MRKKNLISVYLGNAFEHYDTALYSFLSPFFATIFFPNHDPLTALILTFGIAPLGMIARPIGSLVFGHIGDTKGRSLALFLSLLGMGLVTGAVAFIPTAHVIGSLAPLLLLMTRILQNFFAAGECMGGAVYFLEQFEKEKEKNMASSIYSTSTVIGIVLASAMVALLYHFEMIETSWRSLYIGGAVTALFGVMIRSNSSNHIENQVNTNFYHRLNALWERRGVVLAIAVAAGFSYTSYSVAFTLMNGLVPLVSEITKAEITKINTVLLVLDILLLPFFGLLANRYNRNRMMLVALLAATVTGAPLFFFLEKGTLPLVILIRCCFVTIGVWFSATFHSWAQDLVEPEYRYSVVSFAYSAGSQLLGGVSATLSIWLYKQTSLVVCASFYWILLAVLSFSLLYRTQRKDLKVPA